MATAGPIPRRRFRFTLRQLLIAVTIVSVLLGLWMLFVRKVLTIRAATPDDPIAENYFGFEHDSGLKPRNIVVVSGTFTHDTWLSAALYHVQSGSVQEINAITVGRSPNSIAGGPWETLKIRLALGDKDTPNGRITNLGSVGQTRGGGRSSSATHNVKTVASQTLPGRLLPGQERIVYVEGDRPANVSLDMSLADFATKNSGDYLVVTVDLE
jgi:hypothetical protein